MITEEEAKKIIDVRRDREIRYGHQKKAMARSQGSHFMLSGGLFKCDRCGSNMVGKRSRGYEYYVCGSVQYRKGHGCGKAAFIPREALEKDVLEGIQTLLTTLVNAPRLTKKVNNELRRLSGPGTEGGSTVSRLQAVEGKITNLVRSLEDGVLSTEIVNNRLRELTREK